MGNIAKVKWVRIHKGMGENPEVRCRLVAQDGEFGERLDELFAGTPSLIVVEPLYLPLQRRTCPS